MKSTRAFLSVQSIITPLLLVYILACSSSDNDGDFPFTPATPASISVTAAQVALDSGESTDVTATVYDESGNTVAGIAVDFIIDDPTMASITHTVITSSQGTAIATFTARDLSGQVLIRASIGTIFNDPPERISISGNQVPPTLTNPAAITVAAAESTLTSGDTADNRTDVTATVVDSSGNPIAGVTVTFTLDDPTVAAVTRTATTSTSGTAVVTLTAKDLSGEVNVTAAAGGIQSTLPETVFITGGTGTATPMEPAAVRVTAVEALGPELPTDVTATVYDESGNTISDVEIIFTLDDPTMAFITHRVITSELGEAIASLTARDFAGEIYITATATTLTGLVRNDPAERITITGTSVPDPTGNPATVHVTAEEDTLNPGLTGGWGDSTNVTAIVYDDSGDPISGVEVVFTLSDPAMAQIPSNAVTTSSGRATVLLSARDLTGEILVTATAGGASNSPGQRIVISGESVQSVPADAKAVSVSVADPDNTLDSGDPVDQRQTIVTATVYDESGHKIPGIVVVFSLDDPTMATITHTVIASDSGEATATFTAGTAAGSVDITATVTVESTGASLTNVPATTITIL